MQPDAIYICRPAVYFDISQIMLDFQSKESSIVYLFHDQVQHRNLCNGRQRLANYFSVRVIGKGFLSCEDLKLSLKKGERNLLERPEIIEFREPEPKSIVQNNTKDSTSIVKSLLMDAKKSLKKPERKENQKKFILHDETKAWIADVNLELFLKRNKNIQKARRGSWCEFLNKRKKTEQSISKLILSHDSSSSSLQDSDFTEYLQIVNPPKITSNFKD